MKRLKEIRTICKGDAEPIIDEEFLAGHTQGWDALSQRLDELSWNEIVEKSGVAQEDQPRYGTVRFFKSGCLCLDDGSDPSSSWFSYRTSYCACPHATHDWSPGAGLQPVVATLFREWVRLALHQN